MYLGRDSIRLSPEPPFEYAGGPRAELSPRERLEQWIESQPELAALRNGAVSELVGRPAALPPRAWATGSGLDGKARFACVGESVDPNRTVVLGGICSLFTGDRDRMKRGELSFADAGEFEAWVRSWYPRIDQVHDAVGVPPAAVKRVVYVCEDSIWGKRVEQDTKGAVSAADASAIFKAVHLERGAPIIERWLRLGGYRNAVEPVYTSDIEQAIAVGLNVWEDSLGRRFKPSQAEYAKVFMMYTGIWLNVLGIKQQAVISEPAHHFPEAQALGTGDWLKANPWNGESGMNARVGALGFLPFVYNEGVTRKLPADFVPNAGNYRDFDVREEDAFLYGVNLFPSWTLRREKQVEAGEMARRVKRSIEELYEGIC